MSPILYGIPASPPVRSVLMVADALGLKLEFKLMNLLEGEHRTPEYEKMNPRKTVPVLKDGDFVLFDSHAIIAYLVNQYGKDDSLYPKDPKKRAVVDQGLHFDSNYLFNLILTITRPIVLEGVKNIPAEKAAALKDGYTVLDKMLQGKQWIAGTTPTLADIAVLTTVTSADFVVPLGSAKHPNVIRWVKACQEQPWYKANIEGLEQFKKLIGSLLNKS